MAAQGRCICGNRFDGDNYCTTELCQLELVKRVPLFAEDKTIAEAINNAVEKVTASEPVPVGDLLQAVGEWYYEAPVIHERQLDRLLELVQAFEDRGWVVVKQKAPVLRVVD